MIFIGISEEKEKGVILTKKFHNNLDEELLLKISDVVENNIHHTKDDSIIRNKVKKYMLNSIKLVKSRKKENKRDTVIIIHIIDKFDRVLLIEKILRNLKQIIEFNNLFYDLEGILEFVFKSIQENRCVIHYDSNEFDIINTIYYENQNNTFEGFL